MKNCKLLSKLISLVVACLVLSIAFSGCSSSTDAQTATDENQSTIDVSSNVESTLQNPSLSHDEYFSARQEEGSRGLKVLLHGTV